MPGQEGKITAKQVNKAYESHWTDGAREHMVQPKLYTFPIDGAWYVIHEAGAYGSAECLRCMWIVSFPGRGETCMTRVADGTDVTLHDLAVLTDAFYIGGTKVGALFGECVVINHPA